MSALGAQSFTVCRQGLWCIGTGSVPLVGDVGRHGVPRMLGGGATTPIFAKKHYVFDHTEAVLPFEALCCHSEGNKWYGIHIALESHLTRSKKGTFGRCRGGEYRQLGRRGRRDPFLYRGAYISGTFDLSSESISEHSIWRIVWIERARRRSSSPRWHE